MLASFGDHGFSSSPAYESVWRVVRLVPEEAGIVTAEDIWTRKEEGQGGWGVKKRE